MPNFNAKIVISSSNFFVALQLYNTTKEDIEKRFGKQAVVLQQFNDKPARNGQYYGDFYIYINIPDTQPKNTSEGGQA